MTFAIVSGCSAVPAGWADGSNEGLQRVRALERVMRERVQDGMVRSATFRRVVLTLELTDVIVYVTPGVCDLGRIDGCLLRFVNTTGGDRYLRIVISGVLGNDRAISVIGHELRHALEVAEATAVRDAHGLVALFRTIRLRDCRGVIGECYETQAALDVEDAILTELGRQHQFRRR